MDYMQHYKYRLSTDCHLLNLFNNTMETFTPNEIRDQAQLWFDTHAGTYSRLLKRTKAEGKRAFVVFCDLMLGVDYRDIKGQNKVAFIDSFMTSSINSRITAQQLVAGSVEYKELVDAYLGE